MYKPNFCSQCGTKLLRLRWHFWTSRRFCNDCAPGLRKERFLSWFLAGLTLLSAGYCAGRARRPAPPPLTIVRRADSPLNSPEDPGRSNARTATTAFGFGAGINCCFQSQVIFYALQEEDYQRRSLARLSFAVPTALVLSVCFSATRTALAQTNGSSGIIISEFRFDSPAGTSDEFVEIVN